MTSYTFNDRLIIALNGVGTAHYDPRLTVYKYMCIPRRKGPSDAGPERSCVPEAKVNIWIVFIDVLLANYYERARSARSSFFNLEEKS